MAEKTAQTEKEVIRHCHCMGPIPKGVTLPCDRFIPLEDELTGAPTNECDDCGHQEQCHV